MASYLDRIQFDPRLKNTIHGKFITNFRLVFLLILSIFVIGIINYFEIPRRLNPEVEIPIVTVTTILPGATPEDMEALITIPIEDKLKAVQDVDTITSTSLDNASTIVLQFLSTVDPDEARDEVQQAVDTVTDLPEDAQDPRVAVLDFENQPIWTFALTSDDLPSLMSLSENLKKDLEDLPEVSQVQVSGFEEQEIQVVVDPVKAQEFGISPLVLSQAISGTANSYPAGSINANGSVFSLTIDPGITTIDDIRSIRITTADRIVTLEEIAQVKEISAPDQNKTYYADQNIASRRAVQFFVYKADASNIDTAAEAAVQRVDTQLEPYKNTVKLLTISNYGDLIDEQFTDLLHEFSTTVLLIFTVLLVFLGLRQAVIASFTVPLTFLSAIAVANGLGLSLNFLTLFSFLIALGLLIDDTIVIVTAMTRYYASGKFTPSETGLLVWRDFFIPIWSTTATTIWSFIPLLLATGIIGEFIKPIPLIITATMISSTSIAVLITIPLMIVFLKLVLPYRVRVLVQILGVIIFIAVLTLISPKNALLIPILLVAGLAAWMLYAKREIYIDTIRDYYHKNQSLQKFSQYGSRIVSEGIINLEAVSYQYRNMLNRILAKKSNRRNVIVFLVVFALVSYLLVPLGLVKNEFFPKTDENTIYLSVALPPSTDIQTTTAEAVALTQEVRKIPEVDYVITETGYGFTATFDRSTDPANFLITFALPDPEEREKTSIEIAQELRERFADYSRGRLSVIELSGGPPAGADIQISLLGADYGVLTRYTQEIMNYLEERPGVTNVDTSYKSGTSKIVFVPDQNKLADAGISRETLALWLRTYASGFTLDTIRFDEETDITLRLSQAQVTPEELGSLYIQSPQGNVPLLSLGELKLSTNPTNISHEDTLRTITVSGSVEVGYNIQEINSDLVAYAESLKLPNGYRWQTGGINEENQKSVNSILQAMALSFLLILVTMIIEFGSYRQSAIVMMTIPLAISGVFYVFALTGTPLSFPALIGILALFGIVVTNAIVVIDKINSNMNEGIPVKESILDASASRLEPVLLTSLTTIFGLLPITLSDPLWRGLGGAIIAGLFFSGVIKLFFIPVIYYSWYGTGNKEK
ncbi:efflux RND transporter permease subunit [Candidatus Roizmanbacteria bacterium]|nr:MAG: efflux RND transporter permease subunit [Candidatus Roizmanbacteria bacterium]